MGHCTGIAGHTALRFLVISVCLIAGVMFGVFISAALGVCPEKQALAGVPVVKDGGSAGSKPEGSEESGSEKSGVVGGGGGGGVVGG